MSSQDQYDSLTEEITRIQARAEAVTASLSELQKQAQDSQDELQILAKRIILFKAKRTKVEKLLTASALPTVSLSDEQQQQSIAAAQVAQLQQTLVGLMSVLAVQAPAVVQSMDPAVLAGLAGNAIPTAPPTISTPTAIGTAVPLAQPPTQAAQHQAAAVISMNSSLPQPQQQQPQQQTMISGQVGPQPPDPTMQHQQTMAQQQALEAMQHQQTMAQQQQAAAVAQQQATALAAAMQIQQAAAAWQQQPGHGPQSGLHAAALPGTLTVTPPPADAGGLRTRVWAVESNEGAKLRKVQTAAGTEVESSDDESEQMTDGAIQAQLQVWSSAPSANSSFEVVPASPAAVAAPVLELGPQ